MTLEDQIEHLKLLIEYIGRRGVGGNEIYPVGPTDVEYAEDENTVVRYIGPWLFLNGVGETFIEAVEDSYRKEME
jgi:hypothetical protein